MLQNSIKNTTIKMITTNKSVPLNKWVNHFIFGNVGQTCQKSVIRDFSYCYTTVNSFQQGVAGSWSWLNGDHRYRARGRRRDPHINRRRQTCSWMQINGGEAVDTTRQPEGGFFFTVVTMSRHCNGCSQSSLLDKKPPPVCCCPLHNKTRVRVFL